MVAVEKPQQLCWLYKEAICCLYKLYLPVKQARIRPENIDSGTSGVGKPPFGLKLCAVRAVPLRPQDAGMPTFAKKNKNPLNNLVFRNFRVPGPTVPALRMYELNKAKRPPREARQPPGEARQPP